MNEETPMSNEDSIRVAAGVRKVLDAHGHSFHYSVLKEAERLTDRGRSKWVLEAAEVPVQVKSHDTRIDFVLSHRDERGRHEALLVAECKRPSPSFSDWCFAKAPYLRRNQRPNRIVADRMQLGPDGLTTSAEFLYGSEDLYSLAFELKGSGVAECAHAPGRGAIEDAAGQVMKGQNGLIELIGSDTSLLTINADVILLPAIFTTARLWVTNANLSEAELSSGTLQPGDVVVSQRPWVWYRYHMSPAIKHRRPTFLGAADVGEFVESGYARTIAVVSTAGIEDFLRTEHW